MARRDIQSARAVAMEVLNRFDPRSDYAGPILDKLLQETDERQRATDIVFGTIRNRFAIDMVIAKLVDCPVRRIPPKILNIIRIGVYELIFSPQTAEYAIVDEAVENTRAVAGKKQTAFVNAVLRQITRHIQDRRISLSKADIERTLPQTIASGCQFDVSILPDPKKSPESYLGAAFSMPKWLVNSWLVEFGCEKTRQICFASNRRPSIYIRPNPLKTTVSGLAEQLRQEGIELEIADATLPPLLLRKKLRGLRSTSEAMIKIKGQQMVTELPGFAEGLFSVQDITASLPVRILRPQPGWTILDLCAAPGTKTTQLAELTGDKAKIIATDVDSERLEKVRENIARLGLNSIRIVAYEDLQKLTAETGLFDCILLDAPCSNTGVLARRPEVRYRITQKAITKLSKTQTELLKRAAKMIKPKGKICYSTCSIQESENGELVRYFLQKNNQLKLESELFTLPLAEGFDCDGGYIAVITAK